MNHADAEDRLSAELRDYRRRRLAKPPKTGMSWTKCLDAEGTMYFPGELDAEDCYLCESCVEKLVWDCILDHDLRARYGEGE
jgi:hypothetical protein